MKMTLFLVLHSFLYPSFFNVWVKTFLFRVSLTLEYMTECWLEAKIPVSSTHEKVNRLTKVETVLGFFFYCCSIIVVPPFSPLFSPAPSHSQSPSHCPCPWVLYSCSLTCPFPFFPMLPLPSPFFPHEHWQFVPYFHVSGFMLLVCWFCGLGSTYRFHL